MLIDGRAIAAEMYQELLQERHGLPHVPLLGIVVGPDDPVVESFVRIKARAAGRIGVEIERVDLTASTTTAGAISVVQELSQRADGVIVQLPLPDSLDTDTILAAIPPEKDVDGINPNIRNDERTLLAPVALAIERILSKYDIDPAGKHIAVVGNGRLVGAPTAHLLKSLGGRVTVITRDSGDIGELHHADIVVLGAGDPHFVKPDMIKDGCVLIDAGTSESAGKVVGDADPACAEKCALFTPVPGGVGPIAVAMIFKNLFAAK